MSFFDRLQRASPIWSEILSRKTPFVRSTVADATGTGVGDLAVPGIRKGDQLVSVLYLYRGASVTPSVPVTDRFVANTDAHQRVRKDGYISNAGQSSVSGGDLIVTWLSWSEDEE